MYVALAVGSSALLLYTLRRVFVQGPSAPRVSLEGKTVVVTGASIGSIGFETARILASFGAKVVITTRSRPEVALAAVRAALPDEATRARVSARPLDLCDAASVRAFARALEEEDAKDGIDVLVNNAGVHLDLVNDWKEPKIVDGFEIHYRTNFLGTCHLTAELMPLVERAATARGGARVVNVVSHLHALAKNADLFEEKRPYNSWHAYGRSKLALVHATRALDRTYGARGVHAYCLHPGSVYSKVADKGLEGKRLLGAIRTVLAPVEMYFLKTIHEGAQTSVLCATADDLVPGGYYEACALKAPSPEAEDAAVADRLMAETAAWCAPRLLRG